MRPISSLPAAPEGGLGPSAFDSIKLSPEGFITESDKVEDRLITLQVSKVAFESRVNGESGALSALQCLDQALRGEGIETLRRIAHGGPVAAERLHQPPTSGSEGNRLLDTVSLKSNFHVLRYFEQAEEAVVVPGGLAGGQVSVGVKCD